MLFFQKNDLYVNHQNSDCFLEHVPQASVCQHDIMHCIQVPIKRALSTQFLFTLVYYILMIQLATLKSQSQTTFKPNHGANVSLICQQHVRKHASESGCFSQLNTGPRLEMRGLSARLPWSETEDPFIQKITKNFSVIVNCIVGKNRKLMA